MACILLPIEELIQSEISARPTNGSAELPILLTLRPSSSIVPTPHKFTHSGASTLLRSSCLPMPPRSGMFVKVETRMEGGVNTVVVSCCSYQGQVAILQAASELSMSSQQNADASG